MWGALCREFLGWSRLRLGASPEPLAESFGFTLGQAIEDLRALAERDHASRDLRRTTQLLPTLLARGRAGERTVLVAKPLGAAVDAAVVVFHGGEEPIISPGLRLGYSTISRATPRMSISNSSPSIGGRLGYQCTPWTAAGPAARRISSSTMPWIG